MRLLHIDSSILGDHSVSRQLSKAAVEAVTAGRSDVEITYRDLAADPVSHLSGRYLAGQSADVQHDQALQEDLALGGRVLEEFLASEVVVIGVALYNFTVASQLKAWIDRILVAGKTFRYTESGPEGLAGGRRLILTVARGGIYSPGSPNESFEHAEKYLRTAFGFIGLTSPEVVIAEGIALGPEQREAALKAGLEKVRALKAA